MLQPLHLYIWIKCTSPHGQVSTHFEDTRLFTLNITQRSSLSSGRKDLHRRGSDQLHKIYVQSEPVNCSWYIRMWTIYRLNCTLLLNQPHWQTQVPSTDSSTTGEIPCTEWPDNLEHFHLRSQLEALVKQDFSNHWLVVMVYLTICFQSLLGIDGTHDIEVLWSLQVMLVYEVLNPIPFTKGSQVVNGPTITTRW